MFEPYYFDKNYRGPRGTNGLCVNRSGGMTLGRQFVESEKLQDALYVLFLYDKKNNLIAAKFLAEEEEGSVPITVKGNCRRITHTKFVKEYNIPPGMYLPVENNERLYVFGKNKCDVPPNSRLYLIRVPSEKIDDLDEALSLVFAKVV